VLLGDLSRSQPSLGFDNRGRSLLGSAWLRFGSGFVGLIRLGFAFLLSVLVRIEGLFGLLRILLILGECTRG
jgi:hypothetical protein